MSLFRVACLLTRGQKASRASSSSSQVPTPPPPNHGQRLDHVTKLQVSLPRQCRCHCRRDRGETAMRTAPALLQSSLPQPRRCDCTELKVSQRSVLPQHSSKALCPVWSDAIATETELTHKNFSGANSSAWTRRNLSATAKTAR